MAGLSHRSRRPVTKCSERSKREAVRSTQMAFPRLYPILDAVLWPDANALCAAAAELASAGATLIQYRNKSGNARQMLEHAQSLKSVLGARIKLIMNDRADLCL